MPYPGGAAAMPDAAEHRQADVPTGRPRRPSVASAGGGAAVSTPQGRTRRRSGCGTPETRKRGSATAPPLRQPMNPPALKLTPRSRPADLPLVSPDRQGTRPRAGSRPRSRSGSSAKTQPQASPNRKLKAMKEFEREYIAEGKAMPGKRLTGGPLPDAVNLWTKISQMQKDMLDMQANEVTLKGNLEDAHGEVKKMEWQFERVAAVMHQHFELLEMRCRDEIEASYFDQLTMMKVWRERNAPRPVEYQPALSGSPGSPLRRRSEEDPPVSPQQVSELQARLFEEVTLRQRLERMVASGDSADTLHDEIAQLRDALRDQEAVNAALREEALQRDMQQCSQNSAQADAAGRVSRAETAVMAKDHEIARMKAEMAGLREALEEATAKAAVPDRAVESQTHPSVVKNVEAIGDMQVASVGGDEDAAAKKVASSGRRTAPETPRDVRAGGRPTGTRPGVGQETLRSLQAARAMGYANPHSAVRRSMSAPGGALGSPQRTPQQRKTAGSRSRLNRDRDHPAEPLSQRSGNPFVPGSRSRSTPQPKPTSPSNPRGSSRSIRTEAHSPPANTTPTVPWKLPIDRLIHERDLNDLSRALSQRSRTQTPRTPYSPHTPR